MKATSEYLIAKVVSDTKSFVGKADIKKKEMNEYLRKIDAINFLAQIHVSIGSLAAKGSEQSYKQVLVWFAEHTATKTSNIITMTVPTPTAPKRDFKFFVRHTLGPWNPSYWASVYVAAKEGDMDIWLFGTDAVAHKEKMRIKKQADKDDRREDDMKRRQQTLAWKLLFVA